jgi:hypothetical protein
MEPVHAAGGPDAAGKEQANAHEIEWIKMKSGQ